MGSLITDATPDNPPTSHSHIWLNWVLTKSQQQQKQDAGDANNKELWIYEEGLYRATVTNNQNRSSLQWSEGMKGWIFFQARQGTNCTFLTAKDKKESRQRKSSRWVAKKRIFELQPWEEMGSDPCCFHPSLPAAGTIYLFQFSTRDLNPNATATKPTTSANNGFEAEAKQKVVRFGAWSPRGFV